MRSLWLDTAPPIPSDALQEGSAFDAVVVGAGLTGLTTALLLARAGHRVAVLEARTTGAVTTGNTTAKLSLLQGTSMSTILQHHDAELARAYVTGNREGQSWLLRFCDEHGIAYETRDAVDYATTDTGARRLVAEHEACTTAGLATGLGNSATLPFPVRKTLRLKDQAQFHPLEVLAGLAAEFRRHGGVLVEGVRVRGVVKSDSPDVELSTSAGPVTASNVVLATGIPILDRGGYFAVLQPMRSYCVALTVEDDVPEDMYLSADSPTRSLRTALVDGTKYLIVGGNGHKVGHSSNTQAKVDGLTRWAKEYFPTARRAYAWSAQDYTPSASVPYVGRVPAGGGHIYAATGYNKWGMTNAVAASLALAGEILGGNMPWAATLYRTKVSPADALQTAQANAVVGLELVTGWLSGLAKSGTSTPGEGEGRVIREGARPIGICTVDGVQHRVSAVCPHLKGILSWNDAERSWDCPLHGSRFTADGTLLEGPSTSDLATTRR
ncbi:FAD-dependent oxidoreductase [Arthrobacter sp. Leaf234]|uniref:FAD-dependent oxidoreductase n=1 Tax=Arthrobacter sp. Leaf234 TaxID=1736303 RepID=UPI0006FF24FD|nr:FAD-dependent oxidoreductase [Arthrobacter sp. Leaf234]KQO03294.1 FAD-dependent oxidoreductase [Arthrobacter sp. Leaf234]